MTQSQAFIMVLEDEAEIRKLLVDALEEAGYLVQAFSRASSFEHALRSQSPDLCLVDLSLPDKDGLSVVGQIRQQSQSAVMILSGRAQTSDKIAGLDLGADDYLTKPFEVAELIARIRALLRRGRSRPTHQDSADFLGWHADFEQLILRAPDGTRKDLSYTEARVLKLFVSKPNRLITREQMMDALENEPADNFERAMDVRVSRLRAKLDEDPQNPKIIKTIYGAGYIFIGNKE